jgi:hypothetical protein
MANQSLGIRTVDGTAGAAAAEIFTTATATTRVTSITIAMAAATASVFGIGRPAAIGITPTTPVLILRQDLGDNAATAKTAVAWATGPTVPAAFLQRVSFPATVGTSITITFSGGILIPVSSSLVVWNIGTNGVADVTFVVSTQNAAGAVNIL